MFYPYAIVLKGQRYSQSSFFIALEQQQTGLILAESSEFKFLSNLDLLFLNLVIFALAACLNSRASRNILSAALRKKFPRLVLTMTVSVSPFPTKLMIDLLVKFHTVGHYAIIGPKLSSLKIGFMSLILINTPLCNEKNLKFGLNIISLKYSALDICKI